MSKITKLALVIGGYIAACLIASAAVYVNGLFISPAVAQASSGMAAFGDAILFIGTFGLIALIPTGMAIFFVARKFLKRK